ncbi:hypothetical protein AZI11_00230 [Levilactobacillus brevis]|uniref:MucBP domain-containing protein n=1 Tax=Levilactobacillus brevis TaxID=1580 RepID=UPI000A20B253|nr:MucBP domain-containing protein [Levilactobacillus brevis]ARN91441.1 hypothetical protein AZI11_00230 [Levilactobacillus brevis]ARN94184.1 hypothetical protein AZI12_00230 [Levilactobacillus brevis]
MKNLIKCSFIFMCFFSVCFISKNVQASEVMRISNTYQYVSDKGEAKFYIPWRDKGTGIFSGVDYDGRLTFWTGPGKIGTTVNFSDEKTEVSRSDDGKNQLPAYSASENSTKIGEWILPSGNIPANSNEKFVTLELDNPDFVGVIRPLKISLDYSDPFGILSQLEDGVGTLYALTLTKTKSVSVPIDSDQGTVNISVERGSYINSSSAPSSIDGEVNQGIIDSDLTINLVDSQGKIVSNLPMKDTNDNEVGQWYVVDNQISWELNGKAITGPIKTVHYRAIDDRSNSWSGWWSQQPSDTGNTIAGDASYNVSSIEPQIGQVTAKYFDDNGNSIAEDEILTGKIGYAYSSEQKSITGYKFSHVIGNSSGKFTADPQTVTYVYKKNSTPSTPTTPTPGYTYPKNNGSVKVGSVVYGTKHIYLYKNFTFKKMNAKLPTSRNHGLIDPCLL